MENIIRLENLDCFERASEKQQKKIFEQVNSFDLSKIESDRLRYQLKSYLLARSTKVSLATMQKDIYTVNIICKFLASKFKDVDSILEIDIELLVRKFRVYLFRNGYTLAVKRNRLDRNKSCDQPSEKITYLRKFYKYIEELEMESTQMEFEKDVWDVRKLDFKVKNSDVNPRFCLNFSNINQLRIREETKEIMAFHSEFKSMSSLLREVNAMTRFSKFLDFKHPSVQCFNDVNRNMMEEYIKHVKLNSGLKSSSYNSSLAGLNAIFTTYFLEYENWKASPLLMKGDYQMPMSRNVRGYSESDKERIHSIYKYLDKQLVRSLIIMELFGARLSDVLLLKRDCIYFENDNPWIKIYQHKTESELKAIISSDILALISDSIAKSKEIAPNSEYIFIDGLNGKPMSLNKVHYHLNKLININNILDDRGKPLSFRPHKFRHSFATHLAECDIDGYTISRLLGHINPKSADTYAQVRDVTVSEELKQFIERRDQLLRKYL